MQEVNDDNFKTEVLESTTPVVVKFGAVWCASYKQLKPILDELAKDYEGRLRFVEVDVDDSPNTTKYYDIRAVPSVHFFSAGDSVQDIRGLSSRREYARAADVVLEIDKVS